GVSVHPIAVNRYRDPVCGFVVVDACELPGEDVVGPVWPLLGLAVEELERIDVPLHLQHEKRFREAARLQCREISARGGFRKGMEEGGDFAACGYVDARFLLLQGLEPTVPPPPEPDLALHDRVGLFQPDLSVQ